MLDFMSYIRSEFNVLTGNVQYKHILLCGTRVSVSSPVAHVLQFLITTLKLVTFFFYIGDWASIIPVFPAELNFTRIFGTALRRHPVLFDGIEVFQVDTVYLI